MNRTALVTYLNEFLRIADFADYGPQGLQVETDNEDIFRIALAVDTAPAVIQAAADWQADMLLVHHGILWRSVEPISGPLGLRVRLLMKYGINLYAAHLPLDGHPQVGNNAVIARECGLEIKDMWASPTGTPIGVYGLLPSKVPLDKFVNIVEDKLDTKVRLLAGGSKKVRHVAILSGFGADEISEAKQIGADTLITGETSHVHYWAAFDHGINVLYAGHYATETLGVKELGNHLSKVHGLSVEFFDFPTYL